MKEKCKINVVIVDGVVLDVLGNQAALDAGIDLNISLLDTDKECDNELLENCYNDISTVSLPYTTNNI